MSAINGDKARFNRDRKKKIARRARNYAKFTNTAHNSKRAPRSSEQKQASA